MKKRIILVGLIIIVAVIAVFFTFFYTRKCSDANCFNKALAKCSKASFVNDAEDAAWLYAIKGKSEGDCKVNVEILQLKEGTVGMEGLENKDMDCYLPLGAITSPQENLGRCHGLLKEEMQSLIINKLHNYIVGNLGEISGELNKAI